MHVPKCCIPIMFVVRNFSFILKFVKTVLICDSVETRRNLKTS